MENVDVARTFQKVADLLELRGENPFRVRAYRSAARTIESLSTRIATLVARNGTSLAELPGIGADLAGKIVELVKSGHLPLLDELLERTPEGLVALMHVPGLGPKRARAVHDKLGIDTLDALEKAARAGTLHTVRGIGPVLERRVLEGVAGARRDAGRVLLSEADELVAPLLAHLAQARGVVRVEVAGSVRRRRETVGDLDLLVAAAPKSDVAARFVSFPDFHRILAHGPTRCAGELRRGLKVDLRIVSLASFGAALFYFTGSKAHNIAVRAIARKRKLKVNEYGVFRGKRRVAGKTEEAVFASVDLPFIPPELREARGEIEAARAGTLPRLVELTDLRGDLQMHTDTTDGRSSLAEMVSACRELGHEYIAVTDHTRAIRVTGGLGRRGFLAQRRVIERLNQRGGKPFILCGAEVDILEDGSLDLDDATRAELDLVIAAVHTRLDMPRAAMTRRVLKAIRHPHVHILGHPTGRLLGRRGPSAVDLDQVLATAAETGVFLEVNAQPERLDLADVHIRAARDAGVGLVVSTDAHHTRELGYLRYGVDQARRGWCEARDIVNTLPLRELKKRLRA